MRTVYEVSAFTADGQGGNPAGVALETAGLTDEQMQAIATEVGFSETAFVLPGTDEEDYVVRFFTKKNEVDLCGHATIATWSLLHEQGLKQNGTYAQRTKAGLLKVNIAGDMVFMEQKPAEFFEEIPAATIAPLLGITEADFHPSLPPQIVSTGIRDLMVPIRDKSVLLRLNDNQEAITQFSEAHDISGFHVFCLPQEGDAVLCARNFAPWDGIPEEAATGTSNGAALCYLREHGQLSEKEIYKIEQGEGMKNEGRAHLSFVFGKFVDNVVWVGGKATIKKERTVNV